MIAASALALVFAPWALRNKAMLGEPVLLRSNAGLELAVAYHPAAAAATAATMRHVFFDRLVEIHPFQSRAAFAVMQRAGGEISYARKLGSEATACI